MSRAKQIFSLAQHPKVAKGNGYISALMALTDEQLADMELRAEEGELDEKSEPWYKRLFSGLREAKDAAGQSDSDVRRALDQALRPEPGFMGVDAVFSKDKQVVYMVMTGESIKSFRRSFEMKDGEVSLGSEVEEVRPVTKFQPVAAAEGGCGCHQREASANKEEENMTKKEIVKALIEHANTPFEATDEAALMLLSEEKLTVLAEAAEPDEPEVRQPDDPPAPKKNEPEDPRPLEDRPGATKDLSEADVLKKYPSIGAIVEQHKARELARKTELLKALESQKAIPAAKLQLKSVEELEELVALAGVAAPQSDVDFGGRAFPRAASAEGKDEEVPPARNTWAEMREASQKKRA